MGLVPGEGSMTSPRRPRSAPTSSQLRKQKEAGKSIVGKRAKVTTGVGTTAVLTGEDDPRDWDDEEILHGRRRDKNGNFSGKDPDVVPRAVHNELIRRSLRKADRRFRNMQEVALDALEDIIKGAETEDKDRLKAIDMVLQRTIGKVPDKIEVAVQEAPWEGLVVAAIVDVPVDDVIDVEGEEVA